jgi:hypothetical protein
MLALLQRILWLLGPPRRQSRITPRKVRRHTPKRSLISRVRSNPQILRRIQRLTRIRRKNLRRKAIAEILRRTVPPPKSTGILVIYTETETGESTEAQQEDFDETETVTNQKRRQKRTVRTGQNRSDLFALTTVTKREQKHHPDRYLDFGTDSFHVKVDNCASHTMSFAKAISFHIP